MDRLLQLGATPGSWPRDQAALRAQARQIVQDVRAILPVDQYVAPRFFTYSYPQSLN